MGILVAAGFELLIGAAVGAVVFIIGLFLRRIDVFDSLTLGIISGTVAHSVLHIHPVLSIVIGAAVFAVLMFLQSMRSGFWIVGGLLSVVWGFIFSLFAFSMSGKNMVWTIGVWIAGTAVILLLHLRAQTNMRM